MKFFNPFKKIKNSLTKIGNKEHLNFFSILLIIALDIFVIFNLFQGLDRQTSQLTTPREKVPYQCTEIIDKYEYSSNTADKSTLLADITVNYGRYYHDNNYNKASYQYIDTIKNENIIPACKKVYDSSTLLINDPSIETLITKKRKLQREKDFQNSIINRREQNYDTMLLEQIAKQKEDLSIIDGKAGSVRNEIDTAKYKISNIEIQINEINNKIVSSASAKKVLKIINQNSEVIKTTFESESFWYPLKKYGVRLLFLLPLFFIFWFLYKRSSKKDSSVSSLIYAHLLTVTTIPIVFGIFEMIFNILPMHFFDDFFNLLEALNIAAVFNYLLILIGILITMFLIYITQKKLFSKEKIYLKRINKDRCPYCNTQQNRKEKYCYKCGEEQYINCISCGGKTNKEGLYCVNCGIKDYKINKQ